MNILKLTYEQAARYWREGRISDRDWNRFERAWTWSAGRLSGSAAFEQQQYYDHHGREAYNRRINRMRRVLGLD